MLAGDFVFSSSSSIPLDQTWLIYMMITKSTKKANATANQVFTTITDVVVIYWVASGRNDLA